MPNEIILAGRAVEDFVLKFSKDGQPWGRFRVASQDGKSTLFISVVVSDTLAEQLQELKKGDMVYIRGMLRQRDYESNGQKRTAYEIRAREIQTSKRLSVPEQLKRVNDTELKDASPF